MRRLNRVCLCLLMFGAALNGCRSTDPSYYSTDGRLLKDMEPLLYRVAIAPIDDSDALPNPAGDAEKSPLQFSWDNGQVQDKFVRLLRGYGIANEVIPTPSMKAEDLRRRRPDLVIEPRLMERPYLERVGGSGRVALGATLWFLTWIGGLFVEDLTYDARMTYDFEVVDPHTGEVIATIPASSDRLDTALVDRHKGVSGGTALSLICPPFWVYDNKAETSEYLSQRMCERVTGQLTRHFKERFVREHREALGELRLMSPRNQSDVGPEVRIQGKVIATEPLTELAIYLNEAQEPFLDRAEGDLPPEADQRRGSTCQVSFDQRVDLRPGRNRISVEFRIAGRLSTRTIVVFNGKPEEG